MRLIKNSGSDRVIDELRLCLQGKSFLDVASPSFSLFAFAEVQELLTQVSSARMILPSPDKHDWELLGGEADRQFRNRLQTHWLAKQCAEWVAKAAEVKQTSTAVPQSTMVVRGEGHSPKRVITGTSSFTTSGLGLTPSQQFNLIQSAENPDECSILAAWFDSLWSGLGAKDHAKAALLAKLQDLSAHRQPSLIYFLTLYHLFKDLGDELDEEKIIKSATGIRDSVVWKKLYKFQRDGVVGAIDKLERHGGCIIADSVGLGKTFEALAVI